MSLLFEFCIYYADFDKWKINKLTLIYDVLQLVMMSQWMIYDHANHIISVKFLWAIMICLNNKNNNCSQMK